MNNMNQTAGAFAPSPSRAPSEQGQFHVLMENLNELEKNLHGAANRLYSKTSVLLGEMPPPGGSAGAEQKQPEPNGLMQAMTWQVRRIMQTADAIHDQLNRIDQSGLGGS